MQAELLHFEFPPEVLTDADDFLAQVDLAVVRRAAFTVRMMGRVAGEFGTEAALVPRLRVALMGVVILEILLLGLALLAKAHLLNLIKLFAVLSAEPVRAVLTLAQKGMAAANHPGPEITVRRFTVFADVGHNSSNAGRDPRRAMVTVYQDARVTQRSTLGPAPAGSVQVTAMRSRSRMAIWPASVTAI